LLALTRLNFVSPCPQQLIETYKSDRGEDREVKYFVSGRPHITSLYVYTTVSMVCILQSLWPAINEAVFILSF